MKPTVYLQLLCGIPEALLSFHCRTDVKYFTTVYSQLELMVFFYFVYIFKLFILI